MCRHKSTYTSCFRSESSGVDKKNSRETLLLFFQKRLEVAIKHTLGVADFYARAMVFDQLVRMEHGGADLAPPLDFARRNREVGYLFFALLLKLAQKFCRNYRERLF